MKTWWILGALTLAAAAPEQPAPVAPAPVVPAAVQPAPPQPAPARPAPGWPDSVLRRPDHPIGDSRDISAKWLGAWKAADGRTIAVAADGFSFRDAAGQTEHAAWIKHSYEPDWARGIQEKIAAGEPSGGIGPGAYIGYAPPSVTHRDIVHDFDLARAYLVSQNRLSPEAKTALEKLRRDAEAIRKGTYRRVMRYCFDPPKGKASCAAVDALSYLILDDDRLYEITLPLVAPDEGKIVTFLRDTPRVTPASHAPAPARKAPSSP